MTYPIARPLSHFQAPRHRRALWCGRAVQPAPETRRTLFERSEFVRRRCRRTAQATRRSCSEQDLRATPRPTIDIGRRSPAFPVTPPYIRIRIRRFGGLSDWPPGQTVLNWSPLAGLSTARFAANDSTLPRQPLGLHPYPLSGRPELTGYSAACHS